MRWIARLVPVLWVLCCLPLSTLAQAPKPPIKIGLLLPYTGIMNPIALDAAKGTELYLAKIGSRAGGREIQLLREDTECKPDVGLTKTRKLVERDRVDVLVGPVNSAVAWPSATLCTGRASP